MARSNKCRGGFSRDAPRGRRSISDALQESRQAPVNVNTVSGRADSVCAVFQRPRLEFCSVAQIERRPRGVSRMNPLLRFVATCRSSQAMVGRLGACLKAGGAPAAPTEKSRHANKAGNYGLTGHGTLQQM